MKPGEARGRPGACDRSKAWLPADAQHVAPGEVERHAPLGFGALPVLSALRFGAREAPRIDGSWGRTGLLSFSRSRGGCCANGVTANRDGLRVPDPVLRT